MKDKILLHSRFESVCVRVWYGVVPKLDVHMLLGISFIEKYFRFIFPFDRKVVPSHSQPVAILSANHHRVLTSSQEAPFICENNCGKHVEESPAPTRIVRQVVLEPYTQHGVLITTSTFSNHTVKPRALKKSMQKLSVTHGGIETLPW